VHRPQNATTDSAQRRVMRSARIVWFVIGNGGLSVSTLAGARLEGGSPAAFGRGGAVYLVKPMELRMWPI